jgi:pimeloyl-ACP methyl ester carboxylesterase
MRRATIGLWILLLLVGVAAPCAGQSGPASPDGQKLEAAWAALRARNARDYAVATPNGIDEARFVEIGGIQQWITIRGEDRNNPVLLFLHGGPGDATNPWGYAVFRLWLKHFTVVQWDQRGAGRTFGKNPDASPTITLSRMTQDGVELADLLRKQLRKDKIIVVGHSFGSLLGVHMVKARPDLFYAFVGTGQVADPATGYTVAYAALLKKADTIKNERASRELREVGPPPYSNGRGYAVQRKWSNLFEGADAFIFSMVGFALTAPGYTLRDVNDWFDGQGVSGDRLVPETSALTAKTLGGEFAVPVFVIQGAEDFTTPTSLARSFVDSIRAPAKAFVSIDGGGHFAVFMKSSAFLDQLEARVLPLAR